MVTLANAQEPAERHHRVGNIAGTLVDHYVIDGAESLALTVIDRCPLDLAGCDKSSCLTPRSVAFASAI